MDIKDAKAGDPIPVRKVKVGLYQPIFYAGASGDFNPIHIDPEFGKKVGLGGNILQGLCTMSFAFKSVADLAGDPGKVKKFKVRFSKNVKPNDTVAIEGKVVSNEGGVVKVEIGASTNDGSVQVITNGEAEII